MNFVNIHSSYSLTNASVIKASYLTIRDRQVAI